MAAQLPETFPQVWHAAAPLRGFARSVRAAGYDYGQLIARILSFAAQGMHAPILVR